MLKNLKWFVVFQLPAVDFLQTACIDLSMQYFFSDILPMINFNVNSIHVKRVSPSKL